MRNLVNSGCAAWLLLGLACALPRLAAAAEPETRRWVPALAVFDVVLAQQSEAPAQNAIHPNRSDDDRLLLAVVAADGLITPTAAEDETGQGAAPEATFKGAILQNASGEVVVAIPMIVAAADGEMPAATSAPGVPPAAGDAAPALAVARDGAVEPLPPGEAGSPPEAAAPERGPKDETERWVPSFSLFSGVLAQNADGQLTSSPIRGECVPPPPPNFDTLHCERQIRPTADLNLKRTDPVPPVELVTISGNDLMVTPFVGGSLELMTPGLTSLPGRPRLFVHGDAAASFSATRNVAKEGVPDTFAVAEGLDFPKEPGILGQGSTTSAEVMPLVISAGAGVAFTLDAWERRIRIKPSVEYVREEIEVKGSLNRAVWNYSPPATPDNPFPNADNFPHGFRLIELSGSEKQTFHGIGPGLEIEMDTLRAGPFMLAVYVSSNWYAFLGDRKVEFSDTNEVEGPDDETAAWRFEKDEWAFRGFVGLRFRWLPK